ncbi:MULTISPECIES: ABC transporter ATP-binding protein [Shouchella]|uniref:ABC transporter ATP-binding protein n=2 Tax=Bacillaceae TaxID=186817 RepID=A0A060M0M5_9BACI|nr:MULTISPECIES: ABC transporter ATP-binding protein [Bacillaceae]AIC93619.1 ABC transporter ATP-binding protein [Shouchella lehensis G1]KQL56407.1 antibiotic ABC transporter ATP-binding protein [Alkalicoccobacillus plakortidis]
MIEAEQLTKSYGPVHAVNGIGLYLKKGESVGLLGPNGAGKSTLIEMLSSLSKPSKGKIFLNGKSIHSQLTSFREKIGVVPQDIALYNELTARENLQFFGKAYKLKGDALTERVNELLTLMELDERKNHQVKTFSGGMKRRLNLAVALIHQPEFLILDEPTVGIDPHSRRHLLDLIRKLQQEEGKTILYTSHYMEEVEFLCDRIYIMDRGSIIASGTKNEIKQILSIERTYELTVHIQKNSLKEQLEALDAVKSVVEIESGYRVVSYEKELFKELLQAAQGENVEVRAIKVEEATLEDVFLHLTGRTLRD